MGIETRKIEANWKISQVLEEYPDLLDVIVDLSPAFKKLRNPLMRRVQSRLVTVEQAARIAGLNTQDMLAALNGEPRGLDETRETPGIPPEGSGELPDWVNTSEIVELDVREMIERGEEPFSTITQSARALQRNQVLELIAPFEPVPLYDALTTIGMDHATRRDAADEWHVFIRRSASRSKPAAEPVETTQLSDVDADAEVTIDVSELVPPEPMMKILAALEELPAGGTLRVHHVRIPIFLYDRLNEMGCKHETVDHGEGHVELLITKPQPVS